MRRTLVFLTVLFTLFALATSTARASSSAPSAWDKPQLVSPVKIHLDDQHRNLALPQTQDYILDCPSAVQATWGLTVWGGHNIVFENCDYVNSSTSGAVVFKNQAGTLWVHNVHFAGGGLTEGIDLQEPGSTTVVMRDVLIDLLHGSFGTNHSDCMQSWSGPQRLLIDGFTCPSQYQGFFLLPNQHDDTTTETTWDIRDANLDLNPGGYVWTFGSQVSVPDLSMSDVYVNGPGQPLVFIGQGAQDMLPGVPPKGDFVTATNSGATGPDEVVDPFPLIGEER